MKVINLRIIFYTLLCQINWYRQICGLKLWFDLKTFIQLIKLHNDIEKKQKWIEEKSYNQVGKKEKSSVQRNENGFASVLSYWWHASNTHRLNPIKKAQLNPNIKLRYQIFFS